MKKNFCVWMILWINLNLYALDCTSIHIFGDSHAAEFSEIPNCTVHWLGPITMHRVGRDSVTFLHLPSHGIQEGQIVIFTFGEIDARCHIGRQRDLFNRNLEEIIDTLVKSYIDTILINRSLYQKLTCIVFSVTPPTNYNFNPQYPYYGTIEDRVIITQMLNNKLLEICKYFNIPFLDVYKDYANSDGTLNISFSDGTVHIHSAHHQFISNKLHQILVD